MAQRTQNRLPLERITSLLAEREAELRALMSAAGAAAHAHETGEVADFKDIAAEDSQAAVEEVVASHAASELGRVIDARVRIEDGTYGTCMECGEAIAAERLLAMPAAPYCTECQAEMERGAGAWH